MYALYIFLLSFFSTPEPTIATQNFFMGFVGDDAYCYQVNAVYGLGSHYEYKTTLYFYVRKFDGTLVKKEKLRETHYKADDTGEIFTPTELVKNDFNLQKYLIDKKVKQAMNVAVSYDLPVILNQKGVIFATKSGDKELMAAGKMDNYIDFHLEDVFSPVPDKISRLSFADIGDYYGYNQAKLVSTYTNQKYYIFNFSVESVEMMVPVSATLFK